MCKLRVLRVGVKTLHTKQYSFTIADLENIFFYAFYCGSLVGCRIPAHLFCD